MSAEWFRQKQDQLRQMGKHSVPGTKAKALEAAKEVAGPSRGGLLATSMMSMDRGSRMIMMSKAEKGMDKFRKKSHGDKKTKVVGKSGKSAVEEFLQKDAEEVEVANENNNKNVEVVSKSKSWNEVVAEAGGLLVVAASGGALTTDDEDRSDDSESQNTATGSHEDYNANNYHEEERVTKKKKTPLKYRAEQPKNKKVESQSKSWNEVVAEAGGLLVVAAGGALTTDDDEKSDDAESQDTATGYQHVDYNAIDNPEEIAEEESVTKKKKTPLQYRTEQPKRMAEEIISSSNKKMFKEAWNTDKSRMEKRQVKYNRPQNFLLILEDNVHQAGHDHGAKSAGKLMVYGRGTIREEFLKDGIKYNPENFVMHANAHNFEVEPIKVAEDHEHMNKRKGEKEHMNNKKGEKERHPLFNMKSVAKKVQCPGSYAVHDDPDDIDDVEEDDERAETVDDSDDE